MGSDMIVALKEACANGNTLFGLNLHAPPTRRHSVVVSGGQLHEAGETVSIGERRLPQPKQTYSVVGLQPAGQWGFVHGVNEHRVAAGVTSWQSRITAAPGEFDGIELVRLALERGKTAHLAAEALTDLLDRHGQKSDHIYLIADSDEAFVLETCGRYWASLECGHSRVVTDAAMIRQDWQRLSPGLASHVIDQGWWQDDGSKIDLVRCVGENTESARNAQKRWGRASLILTQQHGAIDLHFLRRTLADHYHVSRDLLPAAKTTSLASSFLVDLQRSELPVLVWLAFGTPKTAVYFPICLAGELPAAFGAGLPMATTIEDRTHELLTFPQGRDASRLAAAVERLQGRFDQDAEDFLAKAHDYHHHGKPHLISQIATELMHQHVDLFGKEYRRLFGVIEKPAPQTEAAEEVLFFA